jgi:hypothetical protein
VVLRAIEAQHGLLIERSQKVWSFSHLTFQEYLVAKWVAGNLNHSNLQKIASHISQKRYYEIFRLLSELLTNKPLVYLLSEAQKYTEELIRNQKENQKLYNFIDWINQISLEIKRNKKIAYSTVTIRAFCFEKIIHCLGMIPIYEPLSNSQFSHINIYLLICYSLEKVAWSDFYEIDDYLIRKYQSNDQNLAKWKLNDAEKTVIENYYRCNRLLADCISFRSYIDNVTIQGFKERLLLPSPKYKNVNISNE